MLDLRLNQRHLPDHGPRLSRSPPWSVSGPAGQMTGPDEGIDMDAALRAYPVEAAHACCWEQSLGSLEPGSLEPGKQADLVVLAADPYRVEVQRVEVQRIAGVEVLATVLAGDVEHGQLP